MAASHTGIGESQRESRNHANRARRLTLAIIGCYCVVALGVLPMAGRQGPEIPGIVAFFVAGVLTTELSTSFLLFTRFTEARKWSLLVLACAYLYSGLMPIAHLLTFPGAMLADQSIIGTAHQSTAWVFILWITGYDLLVFIALALELKADDQHIVSLEVLGVIAIACG